MVVESALALLGLLVAARWMVYLTLDVLGAARKFVWARFWAEDLATKYGGKWAVVTGCTNGIGKEYARQLARRGMNILLISRNYDKLDDIQDLIKKESPNVETETVQIDFSHGRVVYPEIASYMAGKDVGILVNNVGVISNPPTHFVEISDDEAWSHINVNIGSVVAMTQLVLVDMVARGKGAIINVASILSGVPTPYLGIYSATKAFVDFFSESLLWELRGSGITVQTLRPGYVFTNMTTYIKAAFNSSIFVPIAEDYVTSALPTLGHSGRTTGYWPHGAQQFLTENLMSREVAMFCFDLWNKMLLKKIDKDQ